MSVAEPPWLTVVLEEERFKENPLPAAVAGARLANTAVALPPAGKFGCPALAPAVM